MLFWDTRKPRDLQLDMLFGARSPMDMLFWGPESNGYAFLGYQKTFFLSKRDLPLDMLFWGPESNFCIYLYQATTCKSVQVEK